ncbi:bifunctional riboflavin kinase/FAD synthetase [Thermoleptolyngbya sp. M55_K2018_002]|uniref:bifunctional riboflavin kinase/FAD synthetase n=1 Tax=Thermoleptolyngbya sp. M55_K2018_002 TaxID=2747808 RepID=UPI001A0D3556|nr:bifunctional riboflavin kinase/FAD synthetase [Thermoleptolyngbya sp. M55_K2018_002]HIK41358.1 bifunctional riboflavin kinase/FAD synthetase [Thermoleptolyngbya sp. M55_K2018_002]
MWITSCLETVKTPTVVALGNFDGVHPGHQTVIEPVWLAAQQFRATCAVGSGAIAPVPTVVTFHPHPREFFTGKRRDLLTPLAEKVAQLKPLGVAQLVRLPFDYALSCLSPEAFVEQILVRSLAAQEISVGENFCFGHKRAGTAEDLRAIAARYDIPVHIVPMYTLDGEQVSSSTIRDYLQQGLVRPAARLLGRPYMLVGDVVKGQQLGRSLGFPTANLRLPEEKFLPRLGVYAVRVWVQNEAFPNALVLPPADPARQPQPGVMNLGYRPTVDGSQRQVEVHLLDWAGDLYGKTLVVGLEAFLRAEQKFDSLDALKAQIQQDCDQARSLLTTSP